MAGSVADWFALDGEVLEAQVECYFRVTIPVYGDTPKRFSYQSDRLFRPDAMRKQLMKLASRPEVFRTPHELIEAFLKNTVLGKDGDHNLVSTGEGLFEFRRGGESYNNIWARFEKLQPGEPVEIGYPSKRMDFAGELETRMSAYVGTVKRVKDDFLVLQLGEGRYRTFSFLKIGWLEPIDNSYFERGQGQLHHEYLELGLARGVLSRLYLRAIPVRDDEKFLIPLPVPLVSPIDEQLLELKRRNEARIRYLMKLKLTLAESMEFQELTETNEFEALTDHAQRLMDYYEGEPDSSIGS